jgi:predicted DNA-binding transcriptional regulator YafY
MSGDARWEAPGSSRGGRKWDRAARYLKIATILNAHPDGIGAMDLAQRIGVSVRTIYRDIAALDADAGVPIWQDAGRFGLEQGAFLPPLALTLHEATTLFLAARVLAKASDEQDPELVGAFVKLAQILPPVLAEHIHATVDAFMAATPANERFTRVFRTLTEAWAGRRVVELEYGPSVYDSDHPIRQARVHPYLIEPSALTHALYLVAYDEARAARRTFKLERVLSASLTPDTFDPEPGFASATELSRAWDVISDQPIEEVVVRFSPAVATRVAETRWHPSQLLEAQPDGSLIWRSRVAGLHEVRIWILGWGPDVEVLAPLALREEVADAVARTAAQYRLE